MHSIPSKSEDNGIQFLTEEDRKVYSVGISTGGAAEIRMATKHCDRHVVATTLDCQGAEFAKSQVEKLGLSNRVEIKIEDVAKHLSYPENHFDFIYARLVLHYLPRSALQDALQELYRIVKVSGRIFVVVRSEKCLEVHDTSATFDVDTGLTTYLAGGNTYSRFFHSEESIQYYLSQADFSIQHVDSYHEQLCADFARTQRSQQMDHLIEILAVK